MNEQRIIKKYPNRRLYDTVISSYITLEDVRRLILDQISIKVIDARTQDDITHNTLLQIIMEQEENGPPLFSTDILQQMIRFYGGGMQQLLSKMFEQGVNLFSEQQIWLKKGMNDGGAGGWQSKDPVQLMTEFSQKNLSQWQQLQQQWMNSFMSQIHPQDKAQSHVETPSHEEP